jgi:hypothetical protein
MKACALYLSVVALGVAAAGETKLLSELNWKDIAGTYYKEVPSKPKLEQIPVNAEDGGIVLTRATELKPTTEVQKVEILPNQFSAATEGATITKSAAFDVTLAKDDGSAVTSVKETGSTTIAGKAKDIKISQEVKKADKKLLKDAVVTLTMPIYIPQQPKTLLVQDGTFVEIARSGEGACRYALTKLVTSARTHAKVTLTGPPTSPTCPELANTDEVSIEFATEDPDLKAFVSQGENDDGFKTDAEAAAAAIKMNDEQRASKGLKTDSKDPFKKTFSKKVIAAGAEKKKALFYIYNSAELATKAENIVTVDGAGDVRCETDGTKPEMKQEDGCKEPSPVNEIKAQDITCEKKENDKTVTLQISSGSQVYVLDKVKHDYKSKSDDFPEMDPSKLEVKVDGVVVDKGVSTDLEVKVAEDGSAVFTYGKAQECKGKSGGAPEGCAWWQWGSSLSLSSPWWWWQS